MSGSERTTPDRQNSRLTIGYLAPAMHGGSLPQWAGVFDAAQKHNVNVICFPGMTWRDPRDFQTQANAVYDLVTAENVDGVVSWASSIGNYVDIDEIRAFHERYRPLPIVTTGRPVEGFPSLLMSSYEGMRETITHLIEVHGYHRLAFIRGPEGHFDAQERYRAYVETLEAYGLPLDPKLVTPPSDWARTTGIEFMRMLLDERGLRPQADFEAIVSANTGLLFGALEVLRARQIRVPQDVAATGFDDTVEARAYMPPLTLVAAPFYEMGYQAVETLLALIEGKQVPAETRVPARMIVRQSCGCESPAVTRAAVGPVIATGESPEAALAARHEEILSEMRQAAGTSMTPAGAEQLLDAFVTEVGSGTSGIFLSALGDVLQQTAQVEGDFPAWQGVLSMLRRHTLPHVGDEEARSRAEDIFQQARVLVGEEVERAQMRQQLQAEQRAQLLREIGASLIATSDLEKLMGVLAEGLPRLGTPSAYLALYEDPRSYEYPQPAPEWSRLTLAYVDAAHSVELPPDGLRFPSRKLVPGEMWPDRRYSYIVEPLYFQQSQIGFVLLEAGPHDGDTCNVLRGEMSSALQGHLLVEQVEERAVQLQTAADVSRAASSILASEVLIERVVELVRERFDLYYAGLFLVEEADSGEPGGRWAVLRAGTGEAGQKMLEADHKLEIGGASMIGQCVANRQARIALDVARAEHGAEEAVRFENPFLPETRSELALPLISRDEVIGALTIQSTQEAAFTQGDIAVLQTMADQLANVIANARLYEQAEREIAERKQAEEALNREQYLTRALLETIPDTIYFKDTESRFTRISRSQAERFNLSDPAEAIGKTDFDFFAEEHARPAYEAEQQIVETGDPLIALEEKETWPDGHETWVSTTKMPLYDQEGTIIGTFGISRDITERVEAERALQEANAILQRRAIQLEASVEVGQAIISIFDIDALLNRTVDLISERFGFYHVAIFLLDAAGEWAVLRAATGEAGARMKAEGHRLAVDNTSMVGWTTLHRQSRVALDVGRDAVRTPHPLLPYTRSEMTLPLVVGEQILGVLNVQSTEEAAFDEDDVRILQSLTNQVAVAIENARRVSDEAALLEATSPIYRASRRLTTVTTTSEVADAIITSVADTGVDGCLVVEFEFSPTGEPETLLYLGVWRRDREPQFQPGLRLPVTESPFPFEMVSTLLIVADVERDERIPASARRVFLETDARALVNIPLRSGEKVIGQVVVLRTTPGIFPDTALRLYEVLGGQAAVALERARLVEEAQKRAEREQTTRQMIDHIRRSVDVEQALRTTVQELAEAMQVPHVSIELSLNPPTRE